MNRLLKKIRSKFSEEELCQEFDERIFDYVDYDQMKRHNIESEHEWYSRYVSGEAESDVRHWMATKLEVAADKKFARAAKRAFPDAPT